MTWTMSVFRVRPESRRSHRPRSAALRSTQNSLPSGSARTAQPVPSSLRRSSTIVAPLRSSSATSCSRSWCGRRHRWRRFFTVLGSGTEMNSSSCASSSITPTSSSPGSLSGWIGRPSTCDQKVASRYGSAQSTAMF
ncbi:hypothetical protein EF847_12325 [Actinobacteria bacterium YIM 96077]|uniref:Uncharacterized protein n=1 Tax=Phytoactinopolyspora halophila TaxID=1981511 RepID=A0A329QYB0_9ACTN|nr:hypothetical protein EF847_12325 [Actinobacteria bacterium YIM 96077]RAW17404.1 hypothetical protein DPM12_05110 [Phytoactinopolyspora halophila]